MQRDALLGEVTVAQRAAFGLAVLPLRRRRRLGLGGDDDDGGFAVRCGYGLRFIGI